MSGPRIGSLCSGYGGLDMAAARVFGGRVVWVADTDPAAGAVLARRYPGVPNLGDIRGVDFARVGPVDVLTAGFPCQDVSTAGLRAGLRPGTRSGVWSHVARAIGVLRPSLVVVENVRGLLSAQGAQALPARDVESCPWCVGDRTGPAVRALGAVLGDLADLRFDARWTTLPASAIGAPHRRERVFLLAWPADGGRAAADPGRGGRAADQRHLRAGEPDAGRGATAHAASDGRHQGRAEPAGQPGRSDVAEYGGAAGVEWGRYQAAIDGWAAVLGRPAPDPVDDRARLAPRFVEWLMGLPDGWVTDVPGLSRNARLRVLGNGVIPQHATAAIHQLAHTADEPAGTGVRVV